VVTACQAPAPGTAGLSDEDVAAIKKIEQDWVKALLAGDLAAAAMMHTEGAVRMPPNMPAVRGRADIEASLAQFGTVTDCAISTVEVGGRDGLAWSWETYSITIVPSGGSEPMTQTGKGLVVWQKGTDGAWLAHRVSWNSDNPPEATASPTR
jgi:ketosteroid isomerase-like protein